MRDITLEDTFYHQFTTRAFATGIPTTLSGTPALSVIEENNATPITAGVSVSVDRASVTGLNEATIVATAANGYEAGKSYSIYISTGTVGGVSVVGEVVGQFTIQASAAVVEIGTAGAGLTNIGAVTVSAINASVITATSIASAAITADKIAVDAIGTDELAQSAVDDIRDAILDRSLETHTLVADSVAEHIMQAHVGEAGSSNPAGATSVELNLSTASANDDEYNGSTITIVKGTGKGQSRAITDYNGTTKFATIEPAWTTQPGSSGSYYKIEGPNINPLRTDIATVDANVDAILVDTNSLNDGSISELAQGVPSATPTLQNAVMLMYMTLRNRLDVDTTGTDFLEVYNDAGTVITKKTLTDDGTTYSEAKMITGP